MGSKSAWIGKQYRVNITKLAELGHLGEMMLDKKTETVLQILSENAKDGYTVLKKRSLLATRKQRFIILTVLLREPPSISF